MARTTDPLLDLSTLIERPAIAIDGQRYELLSPDELSVADYQRFAVAGARLQALGDAIEGGDGLAAVDGAVTLATEVTDRIMVGVPEDVRAKLSLEHRLAVAQVFMRLLQARRPAAVQETDAPPASPSTGAKPPPGSSASTAATRKAG